jgi:hypothetical protein
MIGELNQQRRVTLLTGEFHASRPAAGRDETALYKGPVKTHAEVKMANVSMTYRNLTRSTMSGYDRSLNAWPTLKKLARQHVSSSWPSKIM